jgi:hypothetical protein
MIWAPSPARAPADGWTRRRRVAPRPSPTHARLHGAAEVVVHFLTMTMAPKRAAVGGGSGSTRSDEQQHLTAHLLIEGPVSGGSTGSPSTRAVHGSNQA